LRRLSDRDFDDSCFAISGIKVEGIMVILYFI